MMTGMDHGSVPQSVTITLSQDQLARLDWLVGATNSSSREEALQKAIDTTIEVEDQTKASCMRLPSKMATKVERIAYLNGVSPVVVLEAYSSYVNGSLAVVDTSKWTLSQFWDRMVREMVLDGYSEESARSMTEDLVGPRPRSKKTGSQSWEGHKESFMQEKLKSLGA